MGRRVLAFFLGMIFGIIFFLGSIAGGLVLLAAVVHPNDFITGANQYLGTLGDQSLYDIFVTVSDLYNAQLGKTNEAGKFYSFGDFCRQYEIEPSNLFGGKQVPQEVLDVPVFELIGGNRDQALEQVKVSVVPTLLNVFLGNGEGGEDGSANAMFPDSLLEKLSEHSIAKLFAEGGLAEVFDQVTIAEVSLGMLPLERTRLDYEAGTEDNSLMWAVGQSRLGPIIGGGLTGNILLQFKEGGAFEALGTMALTDLVGNNSEYLNAFLGNNAIADLVDEEGNLNPDSIINNVYIGDLVQLHRAEADSLDGFEETQIKNDTLTLWTNDEGEYALVNADGETFQAKLTCTQEVHSHTDECGPEDARTCGKEEHSHNIDCFGFVWLTNEGDQPATGIYAAIADVTIGLLTDSSNQDALMNKFLNIPIGDLLGDSVEVSGLLQNFVGYTIGDLMGGEVFNNLYIGQLLELQRTEVENLDGYTATSIEGLQQRNADGQTVFARLDGDKWYEAELTCTQEEHTHTAQCGPEDARTCGKEQHTHTIACYSFVWKTSSGENASGLYGALADIAIGDLMGGDSTVLMDKLTGIPLRELLAGQEISGVFESIADMTIGELINGGIDGLYIGQLLSFERNPIDKPNGAVAELTNDNGEVAKYLVKNAEGGVAGLSLDGESWFEGKLTCTREEHTHTNECGPTEARTCGKEEHSHNAACYGFVWYEECTQSHDHSEDVLLNGKHCVPVEGLMDKLSNKQISDLNSLDDMIQELTLRDVLGDSVPSMLGSLKDTPIGQLQEAIDGLYLGELLEYRRRPIEALNEHNDIADYTTRLAADNGEDVLTDANGNAAKLANDVWYQAALTCTDNGAEHHHNASCYSYVWYKVCNDAHDHAGEWTPADSTDSYIVADGMMSKLANEKVSNLGNINETVMTFTLQDVMGDSVPDMLSALKDVPIERLGEEIDNVHLGDFLKFKRRTLEQLGKTEADYSAKTLEAITGDSGKTEGAVKLGANDAAIKQDGDKWFEAELTCTDAHTHTAACYDYVWYELLESSHTHADAEWVDGDKHYAPATGMMAKLAREQVGNLGNLNDTVQTFTLHDVMGDNVPDMLLAIKDTEIKDLGDAIDTMHVGDFLQYTRRTVAELNKQVADYNSRELPQITNGEGKVTDGAVKLNANGDAIKQEGDSWYEAALTCSNRSADHNHDASCYGYVWYKVCEDAHDHTGEWEHADGKGQAHHYIVADGMMGKLANQQISEMGNLNETVNSFTLRDVMGDNVPGPLATLADTPIGDLGTAINDMSLGSFLKLRRRPVDVGGYQTVTDSVMSSGTGKNTLYAIKEDGEWFEAELTCTDLVHVHTQENCGGTTDGDATCGYTAHTHGDGCFGAVWYQECTQTHDHSGDWQLAEGDTVTNYEKANGLMAKMSGLKVQELNGSTIVDKVNDTKLNEVLTIDDNANGLLRELGEVKIGELSSELDSVYVGIAMSYSRKEVDRSALDHDNKWTVYVRDVNERHKRKDEVFVDEAGNYYIHDTKHDVYYEAQLTCKLTTHTHGGEGKSSSCYANGELVCGHAGDHEQHSFRCFGYVWYNCKYYNEEGHVHGQKGDDRECDVVKGLNQKLADLRVDELTGDGLTSVATSLTVRDLIDSEMMTLEEPDEYMLAIIFDDDPNHKCNIIGYLVSGANDPKAYWDNITQHQGSDDLTHRDAWKDMRLSEFIGKLLDILTAAPTQIKEEFRNQFGFGG